MMNNNPFQLVVRFSDSMFSMGDVVALHNDVVHQHSAVWFGKLGQPISQGRVDLLNNQIAKNIPTLLYLIKGNRRKSTAYRAALIRLERDTPKETALIPSYYAEKNLIQYMKVWMKIDQIEPIEMSEMDKLKAINSIFPIAETLTLSSSGYFLVHESKLIF